MRTCFRCRREYRDQVNIDSIDDIRICVDCDEELTNETDEKLI